MRYAVIIEKGRRNYGVYVPDVRQDGEAIPDPVSLVDYVEVPLKSEAAEAPVRSRRVGTRVKAG